MKQKIGVFLHSFCTFIGAVVLICIIGSVILNIYVDNNIRITKHTMLMIDFNDKFSENSESNLIDELSGINKLNYLRLLQAIEFASQDENIDGIIARLNVSDLDLAQIQELADSIEKFRQSGKKTYVYSKGFGVFGQGNREYYLASFFEKPVATIALLPLLKIVSAPAPAEISKSAL